MTQLDDLFADLVKVELDIARIALLFVTPEPPATCVSARVESYKSQREKTSMEVNNQKEKPTII